MSFQLLTLDEDSLYEHVFERYIELTSNSTSLKQDLGILDRSKTNVQVDIEPFTSNNDLSALKGKQKKKNEKLQNNFYTMQVEQSLTSLNSSKDNNNSTTGYVLWSTTPFFLKWLLYHPSAESLRSGGEVEVISVSDPNEISKSKISRMLNNNTNNIIESNPIGVLELGSGISGILPVVLGNFVNSYISTDQRGILNKLKSNIKENLLQINRRTCVSKSLNLNHESIDNSEDKEALPSSKVILNLEVMPLDWENFDISKPANIDPELIHLCKNSKTIHILAMDVIYNEFLIDSFLNTLKQLRTLFKKHNVETHCVIGIHLRSQEVVTEFLERAIIEYELPIHYIKSPFVETSRFSFYYI